MGGYYVVAEIHNGTSDKILGLHGTLRVALDWDEMGPETQIIDGEMHGWGTSGMKSGFVALLIAFINANETKNFDGTLRLVLLIGEELEPFEASEYSIESYANDLTALLVVEPSDNAIVHMHHGTFEYGITYHGQHIDLSEFEPERSASESLREFITFLQDKLEHALELSNELLGQPTHSITYLDVDNQWNSEFDYAEFLAEAQTIPEFNNKDLGNLISDALDEFFSKLEL